MEADAARTAMIEREGYRVIRVWNHDVLNNASGVSVMIAAALEEMGDGGSVGRSPPSRLR